MGDVRERVPPVERDDPDRHDIGEQILAVMMRALGCHSMQGYYFSRPVPTAEVEPLLKVFNGSAAVGAANWSGAGRNKKIV